MSTTFPLGDSRHEGPGRILTNDYGSQIHGYVDPYGPNLIYAPQITWHEIREWPTETAYIAPPKPPTCVIGCEPTDYPTKQTPEPAYSLALGLIFGLAVMLRSLRGRAA